METEFDSIPSFRGFEWGTSIEEVKSKELANYMQTFMGFGVHIMSFSTAVADFDAVLDYVFEDSILVEASYCFEIESFPESFKKLKDYFINKLGSPFYWANSHPDYDIDWAEESDNGICRGPEIYWEYLNGFIGMIAEKYKEDITLTILYVHQKTINEYGKYVIYPYSEILEE